MENPLFEIWKCISRKENICIAIDGSSYEYGEKELGDISILNNFRQFEILYISRQRKMYSNVALRTLTPRIEVGPRKEEFIITLEDCDTKEARLSGFVDKETRERFTAELIGAAFVADIVVTRIDTLPKSDRTALQEKAKRDRFFIGNLSACMSVARAWINRKDALDKKSTGKIFISKQMAVALALPKLLPNYKRAWRAAVVSKRGGYPVGDGTAYDYLASIFSRAEHLITTRDLLEVLKVNDLDKDASPRNDFFYMVDYYLGHFLMLWTAIIDSTEVLSYWRICDKQNKPDIVSFRANKRDDKEGHNQKFHKDIISFNKDLSDFICSPRSQSLLGVIYRFRNHVAHEILPDRITCNGNINGLSGNLLEIRGDMPKRISDFADKHSLSKEQLLEIGVELGSGVNDLAYGKMIIEPILFTRYMLIRIVEFIENIFCYLRIEEKLISSEEERKKYDMLCELPPRATAYSLGDKMNRALSLIEASIP